MRVGNSKSVSYRRLKSRQYARRQRDISRLCARLDSLVMRAESLKTGNTKLLLLERAERVRQKLAAIEY